MTLGFRNIYAKEEVTSVDDLNGKKVRVQATKTEDTHFPAYGAQPVHMPFGEVYTSLQTGVVDMAENGVNVSPTSTTGGASDVVHPARPATTCSGSATRRGDLSDEQEAWVRRRRRGRRQEPPYAEARAGRVTQGYGRQIVEEVDKSGFAAAGDPSSPRA
jgi:hypothetical protein